MESDNTLMRGPEAPAIDEVSDLLLVRQRGRVRALAHASTHLGVVSEGTLRECEAALPPLPDGLIGDRDQWQ